MLMVPMEVQQWGFCGGYEGKGGRVTGNLTVTPGEVLNIYVGGLDLLCRFWWLEVVGGGTSRPELQGGSAGGATDITDWRYCINDRVLVAGGGGGSYGWRRIS